MSYPAIIKNRSMNHDTVQSVGFNLAREAEKKAKLEKIDDLRHQYIILYTRRDSMITNERDNIYCRYVRLLGKTKYENFKLSVEVRVLKMKVELAQAALNRNQRPDLDEIERLTNAKLRSYFEELEEQARAIKAVDTFETISSFTVRELKDLYRVLVRRLHPDLNPDLPDHLKDLFVKGQAAYRSYDIDLLREIIKRLDMDRADISIPGDSVDITIATLTRDIDALQDEIEKLRESFPFNLEKDLMDPVWVDKQQKILQEDRKTLLSRKEMYAERLDLLTN